MTTGETPASTAKRKKLCFRVTDRGHARIVRRAIDQGITLSHMARRMLAYADEHMPPNYVPGRDQRRQRPA